MEYTELELFNHSVNLLELIWFSKWTELLKFRLFISSSSHFCIRSRSFWTSLSNCFLEYWPHIYATSLMYPFSANMKRSNCWTSKSGSSNSIFAQPVTPHSSNSWVNSNQFSQQHAIFWKLSTWTIRFITVWVLFIIILFLH